MDQHTSAEANSVAVNRQKAIYLLGASGKKQVIPADYEQMQAAAKSRMSQAAFAYIAGGAGEEDSMKENRDAFKRWRIVPRMLRDVSVRDTRTKVLGLDLPSPLMLAPIGVLEMAHKEADLAVARAAASLKVPYIFSNQASYPMETVASEMGDAPRWFQLYWSKSNDLVASLVSRAEKSGCSAVVVTLDTTLLGWRIQDLDQAYLPFMRGKGIAQYTSDPVFQKLVDEYEDDSTEKPPVTPETINTLYQSVSAYPDKFWKTLRSGRALAAVRTFVNTYSRPSLTWEDLAFLREQTKLPILLKGILHPEDARMALEHGINGIIVSNHGGRQVDGSISALDALPGVVDAVNGELPVLMDSGIRGGADVFKAIALGAKAVCLGRPYVYALALAGEMGVKTCIENLMADFELTMGLAGCKSLSEINRDSLKWIGREK